MKSFLTFTIEAYTPPAGQQSFPPFSDFVGPTKKPGLPQSFNPANVGPQVDPYPGQAPYGRDVPKDTVIDRIKQINTNLPPDQQYERGIDDTNYFQKNKLSTQQGIRQKSVTLLVMSQRSHKKQNPVYCPDLVPLLRQSQRTHLYEQVVRLLESQVQYWHHMESIQTRSRLQPIWQKTNLQDQVENEWTTVKWLQLN